MAFNKQDFEELKAAHLKELHEQLDWIMTKIAAVQTFPSPENDKDADAALVSLAVASPQLLSHFSNAVQEKAQKNDREKTPIAVPGEDARV